jgi:hypothetical protein
VDIALGVPARSQHLDGDLLQTLATQPRRQLLDSQLRREAQRTRHLLKEMLVARGALLNLLGKQPKTLRLLTLLRDALRQELELDPEAACQILST